MTSIVLSRELANQGHYPAIDVLASNSRLLVHLVAPEDRELVKKAIALLSEYNKSKDMIDVGAYRTGMNPELDRAVRAMPELTRLLRQDMHESFSREQAMRQLRALLKPEMVH
jgi:flagellum-specific ATP synthase